jgi:hypothetical protein
MNSKQRSFAIVMAVVVVLVIVVWFGGGALWHLLLKMHRRG